VADAVALVRVQTGRHEMRPVFVCRRRVGATSTDPDAVLAHVLRRRRHEGTTTDAVAADRLLARRRACLAS